MSFLELRQQLKLTQQLVMTPQLQQAIKLLQLSRLELVDTVQQAGSDSVGLLINAGAYSHTSIAIRDAFLGTRIPFIEVHLSNVHAREDFRSYSYLSDLALSSDVGSNPAVVYALGARMLSRVSSHVANIASTVASPFDQIRGTPVAVYSAGGGSAGDLQ